MGPNPFHFDKQKQSWMCSEHGRIGDNTAWVNCWNGCQDGYFDDYEDDPINCDPGDMSVCKECHGNGGWTVCGECNVDNEDAEF